MRWREYKLRELRLFMFNGESSETDEYLELMLWNFKDLTEIVWNL